MISGTTKGRPRAAARPQSAASTTTPEPEACMAELQGKVQSAAPAGEDGTSPALGSRRRAPLPVEEEPSELSEGPSELEVCPEALQEEEVRLRAAREAAEAAEEAQRGVPEESALSEARFRQLEALLTKSAMYTKFLVEQMESVADTLPGEDAKDAATAAVDGETEVGGGAKAKSGSRKRGRAQARAGDGAHPEAKEAQLARVVAATCPGFAGALRDYQLRGVRWLVSLYQNGINGILADQMGLGKTVQTIAFLCHLRSKGVLAPYLILGPLSTLSNWVAEFQRWAPDFPVVLYHGSRPERAAIRAELLSPKAASGAAFPVVVTSYEILMADAKALVRYHWKYVVVDEGHRLKNAQCRLVRELRLLRADNKLLLTGTPLQNNLAELWSLLNFILPDIFHSLDDFEAWFAAAASAAARGGDQESALQAQRAAVVAKLHGILQPFLLRRVKSDVETSLPGKLELVLYAPMTELQRRLDRELRGAREFRARLEGRRELEEAGGEGGEGQDAESLGRPVLTRTQRQAATGGASSGRASSGRAASGAASSVAASSAALPTLNNMLMQLRKVCNHPDLLLGAHDGSLTYPSAADLVAQCGKMALLDRLLARLRRGGHKILVFSQMTTVLDLLSCYLDEKAVSHVRLDGGVSWADRAEAQKTFDADPACEVFLLSTRAGGLGINLTAADTVIIYDSDWNPHQDLQAMDRCHRIGQTRPVLVLRLATGRSVEGRMLARAAEKLRLERVVIQKGAFLHVDEKRKGGAGGLGQEELLALLADEGREEEAQGLQPQDAALSDAQLDAILDRSHLLHNKARPYPDAGPGYEVVHQISGSGLLQGVE